MKYFSLCKKTTLQKYHIYIYLFIYFYTHTCILTSHLAMLAKP